MEYELRWSPEARDHLAGLPAHDRAAVVDEAEAQLKVQPDVPTRKRKRLRENPLATWELRIGDLRVFYTIDADHNSVEIAAVGVKDRNRLTIGGEEIQL